MSSVSDVNDSADDIFDIFDDGGVSSTIFGTLRFFFVDIGLYVFLDGTGAGSSASSGCGCSSSSTGVISPRRDIPDACLFLNPSRNVSVKI